MWCLMLHIRSILYHHVFHKTITGTLDHCIEPTSEVRTKVITETMFDLSLGQARIGRSPNTGTVQTAAVQKTTPPATGSANKRNVTRIVYLECFEQKAHLRVAKEVPGRFGFQLRRKHLITCAVSYLRLEHYNRLITHSRISLCSKLNIFHKEEHLRYFH